MHYLDDITPGETDLSSPAGTKLKHRFKNRKFLPPIDAIQKGQSNHSAMMAETVDPKTLGMLEKLDLAYHEGSRNVNRSVYWAKAIGNNRKLQHNLKNSGIEGEGVKRSDGAGTTVVPVGGKVSNILKKVLVSMEKK
jgi:ethanolamine utilization protein EutP (predicted NTPase)